jgi:hypothetical protein
LSSSALGRGSRCSRWPTRRCSVRSLTGMTTGASRIGGQKPPVPRGADQQAARGPLRCIVVNAAERPAESVDCDVDASMEGATRLEQELLRFRRRSGFPRANIAPTRLRRARSGARRPRA